MHLLDGKRIIFIGDSFIYYGGVVLNGKDDNEDRAKDHGYFYQLCRATGATVSVTNHTYGGKGLSFIYENYMDRLYDLRYDLVVFSGGRNSASRAACYFDVLTKYMALFRAANPAVRFFYLVSSGAHNISVSPSFPVEILNSLKEFEKMGITIVDWGKMIADLIHGRAPLSKTQNALNKNSFIVHASARDGYHPNQLTGYLTALMTYCAISGESAQGMPYRFWNDTSLDPRFCPRRFMEAYYTEGVTNYPDIFASPEDMASLQALIDRYLAERAYRTYHFHTEEQI